jgi:FMN phosphatase YigB (HAD superfamily)
MTRNCAVIMDVDNTLYNFVDFFGPAFRAMVHTIARKTGVDESSLNDSFRKVYAKYHSLEYPYSIQELDVLGKLDLSREKLLRDIVRPAMVAFGGSRRMRLRCYGGVKETLKTLKSSGYKLIAYTDGQYTYSNRRLIRLGIAQFFDYLVAWRPTLGENLPPTHLIDEDIGRWFVNDTILKTAGNTPHPRFISSSERKPNPILLRSLVDELNLNPRKTWVVGDSVPRDLMPAREAGLHDILAEYGRTFDERNWKTLVSISPWHDSAVSMERGGEDTFNPEHRIRSFDEIQAIVPIAQLRLL